MYPMKMSPVFKDYLWGGTRLREEFGKNTDRKVVAESWEISCHPDGPSTVADGPLAGRTLKAVLEDNPGWLGTAGAGTGGFPLLIKLIDAKQDLSLQVHPADAYALREEEQLGKNEMWYVMDAAPGAELILGFEQPLGREALRRSIADGSILDRVRRVPVKAGDCYCIPAGLLHAIGAGTLIAEIQQNSNVTYRVYDFDRRDDAGNPRELHVDRALDVTDTALRAENTGNAAPRREHGAWVTPLADWAFFRTELLEVADSCSFAVDGESFRCLLAVQGELTARSGEGEVVLRAGESAFLPAGMGPVTLEGHGRALLTRI